MGEAHARLNALSASEARRALTNCCAASRWVDAMMRGLPFASAAVLDQASQKAFAELTNDDYLEAFAHHPRIGADAQEIAARASGSAALAEREQAGVAEADASTRARLAAVNASYAARFGFVFLVCATGKSAAEMLALLLERLHNDRETELLIAAAEQVKITRLRLEKLGT